MVKHNRLTLEIDGPQITAEKFEMGIRSFLDLIKEVAKSVSGHSRGIQWLIDIKPGSIKVDFLPKPEKAPPDTVPSIVDTIVSGIASLESRDIRPPHFSDRALRSAQNLASILDGKEPDLDKVSIWIYERANPVSTNTIAHVDSLLGVYSRDWGSIEGRLSVVSERGGLRFVVYDPVTSKPIRCYFDEDITEIEEVTGAFQRRVSVSGLIRYRGDGEPISIKVDEFVVFPKSEALPSISDVRGILGNLD